MLSRLNRLTRPATRAYSQCAILSDGAHFRATNIKHPLMPNEKKKYTDADFGDHTGRLQNYIWTKEEISEKMKTLYRHVSINILYTTHYLLLTYRCFRFL